MSKFILAPYGENPEFGRVGIDMDSLYGWWEHKDGTEGGGLWFTNYGDHFALMDYDGDFWLPKPVVKALIRFGCHIEDPEEYYY